MTKENAPLVFNYLDYSEYLKDTFDYHKSLNRSFSLQYVANKMGLTSKTTLHRILNRQRKKMPVNLMSKLCDFFQLTAQERNYFVALVGFTESSKADDKDMFYRQMLRIFKPEEKHQLRHFQYDYFKEWYVPVIREIITMIPFSGDYDELARLVKPPIRKSQAQEAVELLVKLDMIQKQGNHYFQKDVSVPTLPEIRNLAMINHQIQHLSIVEKAINQNSEQLKTMASTFSVNDECLREIVRRISDFHVELLDIMSQYDNKMDRVYQFNMQLYPLSERVVCGGRL